MPTADSVWTAQRQGPLTAQSPVTLTYDNGKGLLFTRTISVDENYMFTIADSVANKGTWYRLHRALWARAARGASGDDELLYFA